MIIGTAQIKLYAPWVSSLKDKRMIIKSMMAKTGHKFNVAIAEVEEQDTHQMIVLGIACVTGSTSHADSILDHVITFIEDHTEAEIISIDRENR